MPSLKSKEFIIQSQLLHWYTKNKRILPWRKLKKNNLPNPYYVLISEFMLQQTTVKTVTTRFKDFIAIFPSLEKLSVIKEDQLLQFWSGLGYYARAKNLLKSAKIISLQYKNIIPNTYENLIVLPGIGDYTAKAILGIGYNQSVMPIDTNIERILARLYGLKNPIRAIKKDISRLANLYISKKQSSNLIQAFMDYGSIICLPRKPKCNECIVAMNCQAHQRKLTNIIPYKKYIAKVKPKKYTRAYIILSNSNEILIRRRSSKGMLPSMLEVPNDEWETSRKLLVQDTSIDIFNIKLVLSNTMIYSFSHFNLEIDIFFSRVRKKKVKNHDWIAIKDASRIGMPTIMKKIVAKGIIN